MISILFEKTAVNFIPENREALQLQKVCKNVENWTKGLYPLYQNPYGITEDDRINGIDPGMISLVIIECMTNHFTFTGVRDIVCGVDCDSVVLTNKETTKTGFIYNQQRFIQNALRDVMDSAKRTTKSYQCSNTNKL
jgi:hypothetical protein